MELVGTEHAHNLVTVDNGIAYAEACDALHPAPSLRVR